MVTAMRPKSLHQMMCAREGRVVTTLRIWALIEASLLAVMQLMAPRCDVSAQVHAGQHGGISGALLGTHCSLIWASWANVGIV